MFATAKQTEKDKKKRIRCPRIKSWDGNGEVELVEAEEIQPIVEELILEEPHSV